jgi:putative membrane protein
MGSDRLIVVFLGALFVAQAWAVAAQQSSTSVSAADRKFVSEVAADNLTEVQLGQLAAQKATDDAVKRFAQRMVTDHGAANDELKKIADQKGMTLPTALDKRHQAKMDRLSKLSGADFDRAYMRDLVKDHVKDVKELQRRRDKTKDPDINAWVSKTLPAVRDHLKQAEEIAPTVGAQGSKNEKMGS